MVGNHRSHEFYRKALDVGFQFPNVVEETGGFDHEHLAALFQQETFVGYQVVCLVGMQLDRAEIVDFHDALAKIYGLEVVLFHFESPWAMPFFYFFVVYCYIFGKIINSYC